MRSVFFLALSLTEPLCKTLMAIGREKKVKSGSDNFGNLAWVITLAIIQVFACGFSRKHKRRKIICERISSSCEKLQFCGLLRAVKHTATKKQFSNSEYHRLSAHPRTETDAISLKNCLRFAHVLIACPQLKIVRIRATCVFGVPNWSKERMEIQSGNSRSERVVNPPRDAMIPARIFLRANDLTSSSTLRRVLSSERAGIKD